MAVMFNICHIDYSCVVLALGYDTWMPAACTCICLMILHFLHYQYSVAVDKR